MFMSSEELEWMAYTYYENIEVVDNNKAQRYKQLIPKRVRTHPAAVWPEENHQMSIKVAQKWFH